jgi:molybdate transport system regulatory protein
MKIKSKIWFEAHGLTIFGPGLNIFFKQIDECHSLNSAVKKLKISYRLAWGKIKAAEERLGIQLVEVNPGEKKMHLTKDARELLAIFDGLEKEITPILQKAENKIATLKERSLENEVLTGNEIAEQKYANISQSVFFKSEHGLQNLLKRYTPKGHSKEENEKNFLKSICCLYILPLIDIVCKTFEDYEEILMYF